MMPQNQAPYGASDDNMPAGINVKPILRQPLLPGWLDDLGLDIYEFRLYMHFWRRAGQDGICWEKQNQMAERLGISVRKLRSTTRSLEERGMIEVERQKDRNLIAINEAFIQDLRSAPQTDLPLARNEIGTRCRLGSAQDADPSIYKDLPSKDLDPPIVPLGEKPGKKDTEPPTSYQTADRFNPTARMEERFRKGKIVLDCPWEGHELYEKFVEWLTKELNCSASNAGSFLISARRSEDKNEKAQLYWSAFLKQTQVSEEILEDCPACHNRGRVLPVGRGPHPRCRCEHGELWSEEIPLVELARYNQLLEESNNE